MFVELRGQSSFLFGGGGGLGNGGRMIKPGLPAGLQHKTKGKVGKLVGWNPIEYDYDHELLSNQ